MYIYNILTWFTDENSLLDSPIHAELMKQEFLVTTLQQKIEDLHYEISVADGKLHIHVCVTVNAICARFISKIELLQLLFRGYSEGHMSNGKRNRRSRIQTTSETQNKKE